MVFGQQYHFNELNRIDGQLVEFEWKIFPGLTTMGILNQIEQCEPENFTGRIIFMSMFNDIVWGAKGKMNYVKIIQRQSNSMLVDSLAVIGLSKGLDLKRSGTKLKIKNQMDLGTELQIKMLLNFAGSAHPVFRGTSALKRGELRSKGNGKKAIHFNGTTQNIELLLQVVSVNQLSIYRAVADMIEE